MTQSLKEGWGGFYEPVSSIDNPVPKSGSVARNDPFKRRFYFFSLDSGSTAVNPIRGPDSPRTRIGEPSVLGPAQTGTKSQADRLMQETL